MSQNERRQGAYRWGLRAETIAAFALMMKGYRVIDRRFAIRQGEVDLIAVRGDTLAFVEVKARPELAAALDAVTPQKVRRISTAARVWLARNPWAASLTMRGDVIWIAPRRLPRHFLDAYTLQLF